MARKALIHQIEARERRGRWFGALATLLSISLLMSGWVGLFAFLGANSAYGTFEQVKKEWVPDTRSMELTLPDLSRVSRIYAETGEVLAELHDGRNSEPVPYEAVPEVVTYAILAAEDSEFFEHEGIDFSAIVSAAIDNLLTDRTRGGSTITQQVVKNAFVGSEVTIQRKITEAFVSAEVERRFPKERILEYYMNSVYFGAGAYGVKTASEEFFGKELDQLEVDEAATLAVLVRNPSLYNPRRRPELTLERRDEVIREMLENGWIPRPRPTGRSTSHSASSMPLCDAGRRTTSSQKSSGSFSTNPSSPSSATHPKRGRRPSSVAPPTMSPATVAVGSRSSQPSTSSCRRRRMRSLPPGCPFPHTSRISRCAGRSSPARRTSISPSTPRPTPAPRPGP